MNAVSIPGSEELEVLSPSCIEIVQGASVQRLQTFRTDRAHLDDGKSHSITWHITMHGRKDLLSDDLWCKRAKKAWLGVCLLGLRWACNHCAVRPLQSAAPYARCIPASSTFV
ncbi:hypothetical protein AVEN_1307-1 [Araneus ventricosus]|uniref:Uncharacterized protein n=1 Tax=Araneus ventricosus TaxID=182803 RepID=A0A4Y2VG11_ARAVE|nr:hypothetical protein AVEN_105574-1 [Araneus ventricosus]GBO22590.1 hypothetical protein AVEN_1307-1 [Araneus ventricosus]